MERMEDKHKYLTDSFQAAFGDDELSARVIENLPFPIQIFDPQGTSVMVNRAFLEEFKIKSVDDVVGKFNILQDPLASEYIDEIRPAFAGESSHILNVKVPTLNIAERHGYDSLDAYAIYQDISCFPIFNNEKKLSYVVIVMINRRVYRDRQEIARAKEYMENNWLERFDAAKVAEAAGLSLAHFARLFRRYTGITAHDYYIKIKIDKLKEKLEDENLSITQAFAACNVDYCGHHARVFKEKVGLSPSAYRREVSEGFDRK
ncbi:MAG: helix-turn-helix domain-containing protein [Eubacteriales bacterium]|nr:helix-turn-helix domain-containing protein [Eubacteriales bacterium]MDD4541500.1 helix-turn-helix domain-containing protein [Eubacteriales bacterium]